MTGIPQVVLLPAARDRPETWATLRSGLSDSWRVLTMSPADLTNHAGDRDGLVATADSVAGAMDVEELDSALVCGVGLGAMVALQLAARQPDRVSQLLLVTRARRFSPVLMSLPAVLMRLLPAASIQRLGAAPNQVCLLLDQVRPVDFRPIAAQVTAPATILCAASDALNLRPSRTQADTLAAGRLELLRDATPSWPSEAPHVLIAAIQSLAEAPS